MFQVFEIAKAKHMERDAKYNGAHAQVREGITVPVPNIFDRAVMAVRAVRTRHASKSGQPRTGTTLTHSSTVAK